MLKSIHPINHVTAYDVRIVVLSRLYVKYIYRPEVLKHLDKWMKI